MFFPCYTQHSQKSREVATVEKKVLPLFYKEGQWRSQYNIQAVLTSSSLS